MVENIEKFISEFSNSLHDGSFVKLALGNYKGDDEHLQKINARLIETKKGIRLYVLYKYDVRDTAKNYSIDEAVEIIRRLVGHQFRNAHLFTSKHDIHFEVGRKSSRLNFAKPTLSTVQPQSHDKQKKYLIDPAAHYLRTLGISTELGQIRPKQQAKWRQINKFVEVLDDLFQRSDLRDRKELSIFDMGSGKGYLTFAAYDHFRNSCGINVKMTGVETRPDMVALCNDIAEACNFEGLRFVNGTIASFDPAGADILIALHACDTATDEAIFKGISAGSELIITVPCCHKEIRPQIQSPESFTNILRHGIMKERTAEMLTDGLRSLLLESEGYSTKLFEFVSVEHTPKNNMLVGTKVHRQKHGDHIQSEIEAITKTFGITSQTLEVLLSNKKQSTA